MLQEYSPNVSIARAQGVTEVNCQAHPQLPQPFLQHAAILQAKGNEDGDGKRIEGTQDAFDNVHVVARASFPVEDDELDVGGQVSKPGEEGEGVAKVLLADDADDVDLGPQEPQESLHRGCEGVSDAGRGHCGSLSPFQQIVKQKCQRSDQAQTYSLEKANDGHGEHDAQDDEVFAGRAEAERAKHGLPHQVQRKVEDEKEHHERRHVLHQAHAPDGQQQRRPSQQVSTQPPRGTALQEKHRIGVGKVVGKDAHKAGCQVAKAVGAQLLLHAEATGEGARKGGDVDGHVQDGKHGRAEQRGEHLRDDAPLDQSGLEDAVDEQPRACG